MPLLSAEQVIIIVKKAITERRILRVDYRPTVKGEPRELLIAPFDIGSTNPRTAKKYADILWAYSFENKHRKTGELQPKVCPFDIVFFASMIPTRQTFDENELAELHRQVANYDYRECTFNLLPKRDWFFSS